MYRCLLYRLKRTYHEEFFLASVSAISTFCIVTLWLKLEIIVWDNNGMVLLVTFKLEIIVWANNGMVFVGYISVL